MNAEENQTASRWSRVEALYHDILARPAADRAAALIAACHDDLSLAAEVQSLLDQPESAAGPLARPVAEMAARFVPPPGSSLIGTRIGVFEVHELLGAGGMGEVYRAHDTKLGRDVALKALPSHVADDAERLARFRREARVLASLNHPNIAAIHGVEEVEGRMFLALELVEGEDLSERLQRGAIPMSEALSIARQIAEGLEEAHEKGIVHRDLKPANIKITRDGKAKILDFGLARAPAVESEAEGSAFHTRSQPTREGAVMGTVGYMAPEQVLGSHVDRRADIWAFGVVLYEMLTGKRAFKGGDEGATQASVLREGPDLDALPASVATPIKRLIARCLERDPRARLRDIGEARIVLATPGRPASNTAWFGGREGRLRQVGPWVVSAALAVALLAVGFMPRVAPPSASKQLLVSIGAEASLYTGWGPAAIISPDGGTLAFVAEEKGVRRLFVRGLDELRAAPLPGTEDANHPFFSPDGRSVAFFAEGKLKRAATAGGPVMTLCDAPRARGGAWGDDGAIVFVPDVDTPFKRVSAAGGAAVLVGTDGTERAARRWPQILPGGKGILYTRDFGALPGGFENGDVMVAPLRSGTPKVLVSHAYFGRYVPTGHLIYAQMGRLFAVPFDIERLETVGPAVSIMDSVEVNVGSGGAQVSFSSDGTLVYLPKTEKKASIDWVTPEGAVSPLPVAAGDWANPRFSPDGKKLAFDATDGRQRDIFVHDLERGVLTQMTFDPGNDFLPAWSPDGRLLAFSSDRVTGARNLYWMNADGTNEAKRLTTSPEEQLVGSWHPSGKWLAFSTTTSAEKLDLKILPIEGDRTTGLTAGQPVDFLSTPANESRPMFSPDGRWIAYSSDETGEVETFVRSFPASAGKWRVSRRGGWFPRWSGRDARLMFTELNGRRVMSAHYDGRGDSFRTSEPVLWTPVGFMAIGGFIPYDPHPDGRRIVMRVDHKETIDHVIVDSGFFERLRKLAPTNQSGRP